jgi:hypothetical protein
MHYSGGAVDTKDPSKAASSSAAAGTTTTAVDRFHNFVSPLQFLRGSAGNTRIVVESLAGVFLCLRRFLHGVRRVSERHLSNRAAVCKSCVLAASMDLFDDHQLATFSSSGLIDEIIAVGDAPLPSRAGKSKGSSSSSSSSDAAAQEEEGQSDAAEAAAAAAAGVAAESEGGGAPAADASDSAAAAAEEAEQQPAAGPVIVSRLRRAARFLSTAVPLYDMPDPGEGSAQAGELALDSATTVPVTEFSGEYARIYSPPAHAAAGTTSGSSSSSAPAAHHGKWVRTRNTQANQNCLEIAESEASRFTVHIVNAFGLPLLECVVVFFFFFLLLLGRCSFCCCAYFLISSPSCGRVWF